MNSAENVPRWTRFPDNHLPEVIETFQFSLSLGVSSEDMNKDWWAPVEVSNIYRLSLDGFCLDMGVGRSLVLKQSVRSRQYAMSYHTTMCEEAVK